MGKRKTNILLVCYNQERFIGKALESILMQEFDGELELVVADDASTDRTLEIIRSYEEKATIPFRYLTNEGNLGIFRNYRRAFAACDGDFVAVMEGDDYWLTTDRLQRISNFLDAHPECVMAMNRLINLYEETGTNQPQKWPVRDEYFLIDTPMLAYGNLLGNLSACVFRNSALRKLNPDIFDLNTADWMLGLALGEFGYIAKLKDLTSVYRINAKGLWSGKSRKERDASLIETIRRYDAYLGFRHHREFSRLRFILRLEKKAPPWFMKAFRRLLFILLQRNLHRQIN